MEGDVRDATGSVIGRHSGIGHLTVGQRRGLRIAAGEPRYVTSIDATANVVTLGDGEALLRTSLIAERINFLVDLPDAPFGADVKIRYLHAAAAATITILDRTTARVDFDEPQRAITPGQAAVFYTDDVVMGGGWISSENPHRV